MILEGGKLRGCKVFSADNKYVGSVVNLVFSVNPKLLGRAKMLIFPDLPGSLKKDVLDAVVDVVKTGVEEALPGDVGNKTIDASAKRVNALVQKGWSKADAEKLVTFYLVRVSKIAELSDNKIILSEDYQNIESDCKFADKQSIAKEDRVFYCGSAPKDGRLWSPSLNVKYFQGLPIDDSMGNCGEITAIRLDTDQGTVSGLTVSIDGKDSGDYLVDLKDIDLKEMTSRKPIVNSSAVAR
jgi:sporulation protein YlmC with PRC-barrel domain